MGNKKNLSDDENSDDDYISDDYSDEYDTDEHDNKKHLLLYELFNKKRKTDELIDFVYNFGQNKLTFDEYVKKLSSKEKKEYLEKFKKLEKIHDINYQEPIEIRIINLKTTDKNKNNILEFYGQSTQLANDEGKAEQWINKVMKIPFGKYCNLDFDINNKNSVNTHVIKMEEKMNKEIYGHDIAKREVLKFIVENITNTCGYCFGLCGPMGVGKTELIKNVISTALNRPCYFISLGGMSDSSILNGHNYTYIGSKNGRISEALIETKCMNPIIIIDEIDKLCQSHKGDEITNFLISLIDKTQNKSFFDNYFHGVEIDMSKVTFIFSLNDASKLSKILLDRIKIINVEGYNMKDKINIMKNYIIPKKIKEITNNKFKIHFDEKIIEHIIHNYTNEKGVRKIIEKISDILSELNLRYYLNKKTKLHLTTEMIDNDLLKNHYKYVDEKLDIEPHIGRIYALSCSSDSMIGSVMLLESKFIHGKAFDIKITGNVKKILKESVHIAKVVVWNLLDNETKILLTKRWEKNPESIHVHLSDGSTPKDGPSAGVALSICLLSLLTNKPIKTEISMTGEINCNGNITAIGGLEEKILGAYKLGIKKVIYPSQNERDFIKIKGKYPEIFSENFTTMAVDNINQVIDVMFLKT